MKNLIGNGFKLAGKAMLGSARYHLSRKELYLAAGAVGLGAALASKKVSVGVEYALCASIGIIGCGGMQAIPDMVDEFVDGTIGVKVEDV